MTSKSLLITFICVLSQTLSSYDQIKIDKINTTQYYDLDSLFVLRIDSIGNNIVVHFDTLTKPKRNNYIGSKQKYKILHEEDITDSIKTELLYDVDSLPVLRFDSIRHGLTTYFYTHTKQKVCSNIAFEGGAKALTAYCDSLYFNRKDYNYDELNARAIITILFDRSLKIIDVRIIKRIAYNNSKYNYDALIKK